MSSDSSLPKLVLVTGANGYIASMLTKTLLEQGYKVRGTVQESTNESETAALKAFSNASTHLELVPLELTGSQDLFHQAMKDVEWVMHVASPADITEKDEQKMVPPAVDGTLSMLQAAMEASTVKKFIMTSSIGAITPGNKLAPDEAITEQLWANLDGPYVPSYFKSKTLAERAAWEFMENHETNFTLSVINPSFVLGPVPSANVRSTADITASILRAEAPGSIHMYCPLVDVRDVVQAHIQAAKVPEAAGKRFIVTQSDDGELYLSDVTEILAKEFNPMGYKIKTWVMPRWLVWLLSFVDSNLATFLPMIDIYQHYDNSRSKEILKLKYIPAERTIIEGAYSIIEHGIVPKTPGYIAPQDDGSG